jgi:chaperonin GroEL (HSP60 family)
MTERVRGIVLEATTLATRDGKVDTKLIRFTKQSGGNPDDSELVRGVIVKKNKAHASMPDLVEEPRVALVAKQLDIKPLDIKMPGEGTFQYKLEITDESQLSKFRDEELRLKMRMVVTLKSVGANVVVSRSPIADAILGALAKEGIFAAMSLSQEDLDAVAEATGGKVVIELRELTEADLGRADRLETRKIEEEEVFTLSAKRGVTLLLRSSSPEGLSEFEKVLRNSFLLLKHAKNGGKYVPGGGAIQATVATELRKFALSFDSKEQFSIDSFADALEEIPQCLARNYGLDPSDALVTLKSNHAEGRRAIGVSRLGCSDMLDAGVLELAVTSKTVINRAVEVASLMLGIDDYIFARDLPLVHKQLYAIEDFWAELTRWNDLRHE